MGCIVMACDSGGPLESVKHEETGFLLKPDAKLWGKKIKEIQGKDQNKMKKAAKERVIKMFTMEVFAKKLNFIV